MTVLDTSGVIDLLLGGPASRVVHGLFEDEGMVSAPDVLVFETLAVLRRAALRGSISPNRAEAALADLGDVAITLYPALLLRERAFTLRENLTAGDALFVALAELLGEPLASADGGLCQTAERIVGVEVLALPG